METNIRKSIVVGWFLQTTYSNIEINVTKNCRTSKLNFEELHTVLVQIKNMMNARPLTYLSEENCDGHITPSDIIYG